MVGSVRSVLGGLACVWLLCAAACTTFGPRHVPQDRLNYNETIARSANEQMLLNLVRLRYSEVPVFLALNSVLTQYVYTGAVNVGGTAGVATGFPAWTVGGAASARYLEGPVLTVPTG